MKLAGFVVTLSISVLANPAWQGPPAEVDRFLRTAGRFTDADLASLAAGRVITRVNPGTTATEVAVIAAVKIFSARDRTAKYYGQFISYVDGQVTLGYGRFSQPAVLADVKDLTLDADEIEAIRSCRPGDCDLRLPGSAIEAVRSKVDWKAADAAAKATALLRQAAVDYMNAYLTRGDEALVTYNDRRDPVSLRDQWRGLLAAAPTFHQYLPALANYLGVFPRTKLPGSSDVFYWIKENYGRKPVISLVHGVAYDDPAQPDRTTFAQKQIYASHYYEGSLAVATVVGATEGGRPVSYVIYGNRSRGDVLKGGFGGLLRSVADGQARQAAEQTLTTIKTALERN